MKAIIYAGIGLFSMATVYGITDYYHAKKTGSLDNLYIEKKVVEQPVKAVVTTITTPAANEENAALTNQPNQNTSEIKTVRKPSKNKKSIRFRSFSRAIIEEVPVESSK